MHIPLKNHLNELHRMNFHHQQNHLNLSIHPKYHYLAHHLTIFLPIPLNHFLHKPLHKNQTDILKDRLA